MRFITRILLSSFLAATFAYAQTIPPQTFSHIIIVIQENRTPDNIFGSTPKRGTNCAGEDPFETGVDIENGGYVCTSVSNGKCLAQQLICNISQPMNNGPTFDPGHPPAVYEGTATTCPTNVQSNGWGCGYVYGFRVPLLVVSEYTQAGYVSGALPSPGKQPKYEHDFGSILRFIEYNFGMLEIAPPYYADANTLDSANNNVPLSDFFSTSNQRSFTSISTPYNPAVFRGYYTTLQNGVYPVPTGPDGTSGEEDQ
jgi:phospholipase C